MPIRWVAQAAADARRGRRPTGRAAGQKRRRRPSGASRRAAGVLTPMSWLEGQRHGRALLAVRRLPARWRPRSARAGP
jgi:hypothetical protein